MAIAESFREFVSGFQDWRRWAWLGIYDVRLQNRRSFFGMWWPTFSNAAFVFGVGYLFAGLMGRDVATFMPHLALGYLVWQIILAGVSQAGHVLTGAERVLLEAVLPINTIVLRSLTRMAFQMALTFSVPVAVFLVLQRWPMQTAYLAVIGLVVNFFILHGALMFLGLVCARFRDLAYLIDSVMRLVFFLTPVIWMPEQVNGARSLLLDYNPFYYMIEIVRGPVLYGVPDLRVYAVAGGLMLVSNLMGFMAYAAFRRRLVYWL